MLAQRLADWLRIALAHRGEQHPLRADLLDNPLKYAESIAPVALGNLDAVEPVLTDDPAPERVVQIGDQALAGLADQVPGQVPDLARIAGQQGGRQVGLG